VSCLFLARHSARRLDLTIVYGYVTAKLVLRARLDYPRPR